MKIQPTTCLGLTRSGARCSKKPVKDGTHCNSHSDAALLLKRKRLLERAGKRAQDEETTSNYLENNPEYCRKCRQYDDCLCYSDSERCSRCGLLDGCYCQTVVGVSDEPKAPTCSSCHQASGKLVVVGRPARHVHERCLKLGNAIRDGQEDQWWREEEEGLRVKLRALAT